jgi:fluoride exporter
MPTSVVAISVGAGLGALLRWWLGNQPNTAFPTAPPRTLGANLIGGYNIGVAASFFATFSTFSADIVTLLKEGRNPWAIAAAAVHLFGSVFMTLTGIGTVNWLNG